jgi:hypothetical protein
MAQPRYCSAKRPIAPQRICTIRRQPPIPGLDRRQPGADGVPLG